MTVSDASIFPFIITAICILVGIVAIIALQIFLSTRENKWLGMILPILSFVISIIVTIFSVLSFWIFLVNTDFRSIAVFIKVAIISLLIANIPTIILLLIHRVCRASRSKKEV